MTLDKKELKNYLKDLAKEKVGLEHLSIVYQAGHTSFHTRLRIVIPSETIIHRGVRRGIPVDEKEESKVAEVKEIAFSKDQLLNLIKILSDLKIWDLTNCTERALPDTALLSFMIMNDEEILFEQKVWENCRNDDARTKGLLKALHALIPHDWTPP